MDVTQVATTRVNPLAQWWDLFREGVRGSQRDFTEGHVGHAVIVLAIPMVMEMCMESLFAVVDVFWVSQLGADAVATVGLTESMLAIVYSVAVGLCIGAAAIVARRIGEKDREGAAVAAVQVIAIGVLLDTFLVRTITVPAMATLVGRANWWPSRLSRQRWKSPVVAGQAE